MEMQVYQSTWKIMQGALSLSSKSAIGHVIYYSLLEIVEMSTVCKFRTSLNIHSIVST